VAQAVHVRADDDIVQVAQLAKLPVIPVVAALHEIQAVIGEP